jgi:hypothetical protein
LDRYIAAVVRNHELNGAAGVAALLAVSAVLSRIMHGLDGLIETPQWRDRGSLHTARPASERRQAIEVPRVIGSWSWVAAFEGVRSEAASARVAVLDGVASLSE